MGERSKSIGEHGENVVKNLLEIIGWGNAIKGIDIECSNGEEHKPEKNKGPRKEHGIDFVHSHISPLFDNTIHFHCISSKYTEDSAYTKNPAKKFKDFLKDISTAVDCYSKSSHCKSIKRNQQSANSALYSGVLFWLHNSQDEDSYDDLLNKIGNIRLPSDFTVHNPIYVVDNKQANFLFDCNNFMKNNFKNHEISYLYHKTGTNEGNPKNFNSSGSALPIELITSELLIYRADENNSDEVTVCILTLEEFSDEALFQILGLAHDITLALPSRITIAFDNYKKSKHEQIVNNVKMRFSDDKFTQRVSITSLHPDMHNAE